MPKILKPYNTLVDFVTGKEIPHIGAEANRQAVEQYLVNAKGFAKEDIAVNVGISLNIAGEVYESRLDLVVSPDSGRSRFMVFRCPAGSLGSWEPCSPAAPGRARPPCGSRCSAGSSSRD